MWLVGSKQVVEIPRTDNNTSGGKDCSNDPVALKYKRKIREGIGCQPCANCSILAYYICMGDQTMIRLMRETVKAEDSAYGVQSCPELL